MTAFHRRTRADPDAGACGETATKPIAHHVTRKFYELFASGDSDAGELTFKYLPGKELLAGEKHLFERHTLEALEEKLDGRDLHFETTVSKKQENPPLPYNLTVLLSDMSERFGFTAAETQQITQDLRDKYKAITYNRSDSQYLKEEHREQAPAVLAQAMRTSACAGLWITGSTPRRSTMGT